MDYKEKLKAIINSNKTPFVDIDTFLKYFPELKESENERIRKALIELVRMVDKNPIHQIFGYGDIKYSDMIAWLEKQGEQEEPQVYDTGDGEVITYSETEGYKVVEPKFHEGDWVIYNNDICQIVKREEGCNILVTQFGVEKEPVNERNLSTAKLWDISDAKDVDVLVNGSNIFIFHFINGTRLMGYCHVNTDNGRFYDDIGKNECFCLIDAVVNPATKEQRDLLFQKMKEAGYIFDFKNKELKEIETEIEIPFGAKDSELQEATYYIPKGFHAEIDDDKVVIKKGEKHTAWSEDDERIKKRLINLVNEVYANTNYITFLEHKELLAWLEKLDDNVEL